MAHPEQRKFFEGVRRRFPTHFKGARVVDCGSLDVNGSLRDLFDHCEYLGVDIRPGKNVHLVSAIHDAPIEDGICDTVVSAEMLEHDEHWAASLRRMYALLRPKGLLVLSAAGKGREEHGTESTPDIKAAVYGSSPGYYRNLEPADLVSAFGENMPAKFTAWKISRHKRHRDLYFFGVRR